MFPHLFYFSPLNTILLHCSLQACIIFPFCVTKPCLVDPLPFPTEGSSMTIAHVPRQNVQDFQVRNFLKVKKMMKESIDFCAEQTLTNTDTMKYIIYDNIIR